LIEINANFFPIAIFNFRRDSSTIAFTYVQMCCKSTIARGKPLICKLLSIPVYFIWIVGGSEHEIIKETLVFHFPSHCFASENDLNCFGFCMKLKNKLWAPAYLHYLVRLPALVEHIRTNKLRWFPFYIYVEITCAIHT